MAGWAADLKSKHVFLGVATGGSRVGIRAFAARLGCSLLVFPLVVVLHDFLHICEHLGRAVCASTLRLLARTLLTLLLLHLLHVTLGLFDNKALGKLQALLSELLLPMNLLVVG